MSSKKQTIEQQLEDLRLQIAWFDSDDFTLEVALDRFAKVEALAQTIDTELAEFKNTIAVVRRRFDEVVE